MASPAQIFANRENSKKSTGPATPEGKAASSRNHTTHGLSAADPVLPTEDRDEFDALVAEYKSEYQVTTASGEFMVLQMAGARWKLDRVARLENEMLATLDDLTKAFTDSATAGALARLERYRAALERTYHRCQRELRAQRKEQIEANSTQMAEKKFETLLKRMLESPPPGFNFEPRLVRADPTKPITNSPTP